VDDLDFIKRQLAQMPTRNEVWRAAMLGMLGGAVAAVTLIEAFARSARRLPDGEARYSCHSGMLRRADDDDCDHLLPLACGGPDAVSNMQ
jgi:hypothetical protein